MDIDLTGRTAIVCGSTQGIGLAIAQELSSLGANLILISRNELKLKDVLTTLAKKEGQHHEYLVADFQEPERLKTEVQKFLEKATRIDILVNNTGGPPAGKAIDASIADFLMAFNQHLVCNQILVQAVVPLMEKHSFGRIINVISTSVKMPIAGLGVSNTIRGAVASWSKTLSVELAPLGITVNNVLPGATSTGRLTSIIKNKAQKSGIDYEKAEQDMINEIPMGRIGDPKDLAAAAAFLASPAAGYINGISMAVDGGRTNCL